MLMKTILNLSNDDVEDKKVFMFGLIMECPLPGDPNPSFCQLHDVRLRPIEEGYRWVEALSDDICAQNYIKHRKCYLERAAKMGMV
jgi:hypothetical protein